MFGQNNAAFTELRLEGNPTICDVEGGFDSFAICRMIGAISHNTVITALDLRNCQLGSHSEGEEVMSAVVESLAMNSTLRCALACYRISVEAMCRKSGA